MSLTGDVIQSSSYMHIHSQEALKASVFARWFTTIFARSDAALEL